MLTVMDGAQEGPGACQPPPAPLGLSAVKRLLRGAERLSPASCSPPEGMRGGLAAAPLPSPRRAESYSLTRAAATAGGS